MSLIPDPPTGAAAAAAEAKADRLLTRAQRAALLSEVAASGQVQEEVAKLDQHFNGCLQQLVVELKNEYQALLQVHPTATCWY